MGFSRYFINNIKRGKVERFYLFFSAKNFPLQRKNTEETGKNKKSSQAKKHEKKRQKRLKKDHQKIAKTPIFGTFFYKYKVSTNFLQEITT